MSLVDVKVPDIGGFDDVPVIEILVKVGDSVKAEESLITLESDKATMEVPAPQNGVVKEILVKVGDKISEGTLIVRLEAEKGEAAATSSTSSASSVASPQPQQAPTPANTSADNKLATSHAAKAPSAAVVSGGGVPRADATRRTEVLVLGAGPGGYSAAFRAADLGKKVTLIERYKTLGGVCLNVGCIPSKALLHAAKVITEAEEMAHFGVKLGKPEVEVASLLNWKNSVIGKLTKGLTGLAKQRKVDVVHGKAEFVDDHHIRVNGDDGQSELVFFEHAIIAAGSQSTKIPGFPYDDERLVDSTGALELRSIPKRLLVIGGGIIGLEMACVYDALGSKVTVVELGPQLIPGVDADIVKPLHKRIEKRYEAIYLNTKVAKLEATPQGLKATFEGANEKVAPQPDVYDRVLLAVGRRPNGKLIGAEKAGVNVDDRGFISVDNQQRTNIPHIFAIGDIAGDPMLAHKAVHEAKVAAEVIAGHAVAFEAKTIPSVAYTDPEIAWMGLTEIQAKAKGIAYEKASFPWAASGRSLAMGREEGITKVLLDPATRRILGASFVGPNAGELVAEAVLALEMGADMHDIGLSVHPHPTLSETLAMAAEMAEGTITDLFVPKKK
ncbi:MAG: dihydrolipoyl dehydrogenase [Pseudomonadota bacterium]